LAKNQPGNKSEKRAENENKIKLKTEEKGISSAVKCVTYHC
jgi:hypothetical protein